jgi:hypothetical protein
MKPGDTVKVLDNRFQAYHNEKLLVPGDIVELNSVYPERSRVGVSNLEGEHVLHEEEVELVTPMEWSRGTKLEFYKGPVNTLFIKDESTGLDREIRKGDIVIMDSWYNGNVMWKAVRYHCYSPAHFLRPVKEQSLTSLSEESTGKECSCGQKALDFGCTCGAIKPYQPKSFIL